MDSSGPTILVVDDHPVNLKLVCEVLGAHGFAVLGATGAQQALELLARGAVALVLMDIQMPGMDGLTLTRLLKQDPAYREIPIVALTAFAMKGDAEKAQLAGCDGYITKPVDTRELPETVRRIIENAAQRRQAPP